MIKVNLIVDHTMRGRRVSVTPKVSRMGLVYTAVLLVIAAGLGAYWYILDRQVNTLTDTRDRLRAEDQRLKGLKAKLAQFEKLKQVRQSRIDVIERLKESQTGPVLLLNHVIQSIPRDGQLWLTTFSQKGERVQIVGFALHSDVIPDFMSNLATTNVFKSVELELIQEDKEAAKFSLLCVTTQKNPRGADHGTQNP
jgi:Tfp pilus assembly protein PilN